MATVFTKETITTPPANNLHMSFDTTLGAMAALDSAGNKYQAAGITNINYRLYRVTNLTTAGSGTYTPSPNVAALYVECWGGGGGGGGVTGTASNANAASGGNAGSYAASWLTSIAASYAYVVGGGGGGGAATGANGTAGTDTTWGSGPTIKATGGTGGVGSATAGTTAVCFGPPAANAASVGDFTIRGSFGGPGMRFSGINAFGGRGGNGAGGAAPWTPAAGAGANAGNYGSGGAGACSTASAAAGGNGQQGFIRVWEFVN